MNAFPMQPEIDRDRWGRPMVVPPEGGQPTAYTRCTTFVNCLEDTTNLSKWKLRMVARGFAQRNDLLLAAASTHVDDKKKLDAICEQALDAAAAGAAATTGTALHALTEPLDRGDKIAAHLPPDAKRDLAAYVKATEPLTCLAIERFCVLDDWKIGGTPDRIVEFEGRNYIADIKTGNVSFGALKIGMQLAVYAHSRFYDVRTQQRSDLPDVDQQRAIVIHLPAGEGTCQLLWVDIGKAWEALPVAKQVRDWRQQSGRMLSPLTSVIDTPLPLTNGPSELDVLRNAVASARSADELTSLWGANRQLWNDELTQLASARKALLTGAVA